MSDDTKKTLDEPKASAPVKEEKPAARAERAKYARYTGDGTQSLGGIPARNLKADEWAALTEEQRTYALESGLYVEA